MMEYWKDGRMKDNLEDRIPKTVDRRTPNKRHNGKTIRRNPRTASASK
jgi:hypothetical protein